MILIIILKWFLIFLILKNTLCKDELDSGLGEIEKYQLKMIYDCFNEALDSMRPFGIRGKPLEWKINNQKIS